MPVSESHFQVGKLAPDITWPPSVTTVTPTFPGMEAYRSVLVSASAGNSRHGWGNPGGVDKHTQHEHNYEAMG